MSENLVEKKLNSVDLKSLSLFSNSANNSIPYSVGSYINTGDTAKDSQYLANSTIQRAAQDAAAAGINPTWYLTQGGSTSGASSAGAINSTATKQELKIAQQNADSNTMTAKAQMLNAHANTAKAVSSFLPSRSINKNTSTSLAKVLTGSL